MTEADTFKKLKRIPYKQMATIWQVASGIVELDNEFFTQYGWTYDEFWDKFNRNLSKVNNHV
jgi:hypothetical protein